MINKYFLSLILSNIIRNETEFYLRRLAIQSFNYNSVQTRMSSSDDTLRNELTLTRDFRT